MCLEWEQVVVHSKDPVSLAMWWVKALGWVVIDSSEEEVEIRREADLTPGLIFVHLDERKDHKNRLHLDFRPDDQREEVARLLVLGARHVDVGQGEQSWVVLCDPEGNEFCVLSSRHN